MNGAANAVCISRIEITFGVIAEFLWQNIVLSGLVIDHV